MKNKLLKQKRSIKASKAEDSCHITVEGFSNKEELQQSMFGVAGDDTFNKLLSQLTSSSIDEHVMSLNSLSPLLLNIKPQDAIEGMLAVQIISTHNMAVEMNRRAMSEEMSPEASEKYCNKAVKLMGLFTSQIDTLEKRRNKGQQTIQVQHVNVESGGQAVVGNVNQERG